MKYNSETKTLLFETSGRMEICNRGVVGINEEGKLFQGYDGMMSFFKMDEESFEYEDNLSLEERNELVNYMIGIWTKYRNDQSFKIRRETIEELARVFSSINDSAKKNSEIVNAMSASVNSAMESSYLKLLSEITINIVYLSSRRDKARFGFMRKWYDRKIEKSNKLLYKAECGLNRVKALK